jgi:deoxyribodipyrimidine photo-lyase
MNKTSLIWFRRDLRLQDNLALIKSVEESNFLVPIYIFEEQEHGSANKWWLHHSLVALEESLRDIGLPLLIFAGNPVDIIPSLVEKFNIDAIYWNRCYEPYAVRRDTEIKKLLTEKGIYAKSYNSSLLFEPFEIKNSQGEFFKIFTPFWKKCLSELGPNHFAHQFFPEKISSLNIASEYSVDDLKLLPTNPDWASGLRAKWLNGIGEKAAAVRARNFIQNKLVDYAEKRDFPAADATSELSAHLHFGEIGPRQIYSFLLSQQGVDHAKFFSEIGWREFANNLLYHFPDMPSKPFQKKFEDFPWETNEEALKAWKYGNTGCPIIDAGMRELTRTGIMHNRVRMLVASYLTKNLKIHWKIGADWFFDRLVDADLANNSAGWQWVAGCGADAAPYFRVFNPLLQAKKFDANADYIRRYNSIS